MPQSLARVYVHIVFGTKERRPLLVDRALRGRLHRRLASLCGHLGSPALEIGGVSDHVHILCALGRRMALADLVKELKRRSALWLRSDGAIDEFGWQVGYGAFSVGPRQVPRVARYIRDQERHHRELSFDEELERLAARSTSE